MSLFSTIGSYEDAWKAIIMPFRQEYNLYDLGPTEFVVKDNRIKRSDFRLLNKQGQVLECSYFQQVNIDTPVPCVIYLHGNGCSRIEALSYTNIVLSQPVSFFCFDFRGCGKSEGQYTSVGWHEQEDLECVIQYLCNTGKVSKVAVWGRSMGAVTAILYANRDPRIDCFIFDSPFSNFKQLVKELAKQKAFIPGFLVNGAFGIVRKTILKEANFDLDALRPIKYVDKIKIPALFGTAKDDSFVAPKHTKDLYMAYGGPKRLLLFDGDHNSQRPFNWMLLVQEFIKTHLLGEQSEPQHVAKPFKQAVSPAEKPMDSPVEPKIEIPVNVNTTQSTAKEVAPVRKDVPVQKPQFQSQMSFSWLDHSASSPNLALKSPSQTSLSEKVMKEQGVEDKSPVSSEKRLQNLFPSKKENVVPTRPPKFMQQSHTPKSAVINLDITPKSSNHSDKSPTLQEHSKPLKFALKNNYGLVKSSEERLVKNTSSINLSSHSNISIFGPKQREIHSENIIGSPMRQVAPPKSNILLKEISTFQLNNTSNIQSGSTTPHQKAANATTIVHVDRDKSPAQKLNTSNLEVPVPDAQQSRSRERKNLTLIPNMLSIPLRRVDSQRDPKRIFDNSGAQTHKENKMSTRSPNKSFTIDSKNLKLTKENSSPTPRQKGLVLQVKLNSDVPFINPNQTGASVNLSSLANGLNNAKGIDSRRNSDNVVKSYNGLPNAENVKPSAGIFNEPKGYRDNMKIPLNLMENPLMKFSSELPPKGPQRDARKRHELVK